MNQLVIHCEYRSSHVDCPDTADYRGVEVAGDDWTTRSIGVLGCDLCIQSGGFFVGPRDG